MAMKSNSDEPAIPVDGTAHHFSGLSKREYLAGQAIIATARTCVGNTEMAVKKAVAIADALLAELAK